MSMLGYGNLGFLAASVIFYVLLGGADFGVGILELTMGRTQRERSLALMTEAMAPVWEANHMWLVLAVVILFTGFPRLYTEISIYLYLPITAVLIGVTFRGCAFTFRHYDTLSPKPYGYYSWVFKLSSAWTAFFLGVLAGAPALGRIGPTSTTFYDSYVAPWCNPFCLALGVFTMVIFALLATVYLVGEATGELRAMFRRQAALLGLAVVTMGAVVFATGEFLGMRLVERFFGNQFSMSAFVIATFLIGPFWWLIARNGNTVLARTVGALVVSCVVIGWLALQYPAPLVYQPGTASLTFASAAAPEATQRSLLGALLVGSLLIFPALFYLIKVFKQHTFR